VPRFARSAALAAALALGCAHAAVVRAPDGSVRTSAWALGQASASAAPEGAVAVEGGPLSQVFEGVVEMVALAIQPYVGGAAIAAHAAADATKPAKAEKPAPRDPFPPPSAPDKEPMP